MKESTTPLLDGFGNFMCELIPGKFRGEFGWIGGRRIGLREIGVKELGQLKMYLSWATPDIDEYSTKLQKEKYLTHPNGNNEFRAAYDSLVTIKINAFIDSLVCINKDLITDKDVKANFYKSMERQRNIYLNIFVNFNADITKRAEKGKQTANPEPSIKQLNDSELKEIFKASKIDSFKSLEQRLYDRNYIDKNRKWLTKAPELVALVLVLKDKRYFRNAVSDNKIRNFFQARYQIDISKQFQPNRHRNADKHKKEFKEMLDGLPKEK